MTTLFLIVALVLGGLGVYITRRDPKWGTPLLVGAAIVTVLYLIWDHDESRASTGVTPTSPAVSGQISPSAQSGIPVTGSAPPPAGPNNPSPSPTTIPTVSLFPGK
jgi:hypothetical protein